MLGVFFIKLLDTSCGVNEFLLAGKKRMAGRTYLHLYLFVHGSEFNFIAAGTLGLDLMVSGMDVRFHVYIPPKSMVALL